MRPTEKIDELFKRSKVRVSDAADKKMIADALTTIKQQDSLAEVEPDAWRIIMQSKFIKLAVAAIIIVSVLVGINQFGASISLTSVAWADVVEKFGSMSFYNAVLYFKEDAASEAKQIELWVSSEHKARIRVGSQILFAENGKVVAGYSFKDKRLLKEDEYESIGVGLVENICQCQTLSLENVVQMLYKGKLVETTPKINSDAMISQDLLVFDLSSIERDEWTRIWTLRESKLPVRLRTWDPRDGECLDVFVTYEKQQPAEFFNHQKYEEILVDTTRSDSGSMASLAYALLKDHGGRNYTPESMSDSLEDLYPVKGHLSKDEVTKYYQANPLESGQVEFRAGKRKGGLTISFSIPGHKFMQLGTSVPHLVQSYHHPPYGRFRFKGKFDRKFIQFDIIYRDDVSIQKVIELALSKVGLEIVESEDDCTVWVAEYTGQQLKPMHEVKCPVSKGDGPGTLSAAYIFKIDGLLRRLAKHQDIIVEDETGIDKETQLTHVIPNFEEKTGAEMAEKWYRDNFGITFRKETRRMPVWIVRKKP